MNQLEKARQYVLENKHIVDKERPVYHLSPAVGWMNDPNGFSVYKGEYHLFYQHYPYDTIWGAMHWGHAKTKDFITWKHLPISIAPDKPYDESGCFSGCAVEMPDGKQMIFYTGVTPYNFSKEVPEADLPPEAEKYQNQCVAIGDGVNFEKSATNPVLLSFTAPEGTYLCDFRDPKIWREEDGTYYCIISSRPASGLGDVLLYKSEDALHWEYVSIITTNDGNYGRMWECPDLFTIDGKDVMLVSPMEMKEQGLEYHNGHITMALIGTYDREHHVFKDEARQAIDYGINFYSTQSVTTLDGRQVMIAWMANWCEQDIRMEGLHFYGMNTIPRELHVVNNRLIQNPVRELELYRKNKVSYKDVVITGSDASEHELTLDGIKGRILDLTLELKPEERGSYEHFDMKVAKDENHHLLLQHFPKENIVSVNRRNCGENMKEVQIGRFYVKDQDGYLKLRILMDKYSIELFANDGEQAATYTFYTDLAADEITFDAAGTVHMDIVKHDITR